MKTNEEFNRLTERQKPELLADIKSVGETLESKSLLVTGEPIETDQHIRLMGDVYLYATLSFVREKGTNEVKGQISNLKRFADKQHYFASVKLSKKNNKKDNDKDV